MSANRATAVVSLILAVILATVIIQRRGPEPLSSSAPPDRFSAARAMGVLASILGDGSPHPIGSPAHDVIRDRVAAQLRQLGYETSLQQAFACNAYGTCAPVANVIARLPGDPRADILMLSAHYDSVGAGPGASDDGVGVATLIEVARAIRHQHFRNRILFVITDGEEDGLLGAEGFIADPNVSRGVAAAINIENRGTSGRSNLFETSRHNRWLMPLIAHGLERPVASSLFFNLYELLPNDTDLTVFKRAGMAGINFAAIGRVGHYHTPLDDLRHVTPSTVQDHGDHILGMTRALGNTDLLQSTNDDAVFFDVLGFRMLWWPQPWTKWMAMAAFVVLLIGAANRARGGDTRARAITLGVFSFFLSMIAAAALGGALAWIASMRSAKATWVAQPGPMIAAMWLIGSATAIVCATWLRPRAGYEGLFIGHALCWTAMSIALAIFLPGGAYLAVLPALAFAICTLAASAEVSVIVTSLVAAVLWFPIISALYDLVGYVALGAIAATVALVSTTFTALISVRTPTHRAIVAAMVTTAIACIGMQLLLPPYTAEWPKRMNIQRRALNPPQCEGGNVIRCRSMRGAQRIALKFYAPDLVSLRINGVTPPQQPPKFRRRLAPGWHSISVRGASEAQIEIVRRGSNPLEVEVSDWSFGLPPEAAAEVRARAAASGVPSNEGDTVWARGSYKVK
ncbi:MAG TPA: M20/M25/M40 family metallo-hydrolase [Thermoanaerobaculia bacterium]|nr:M20/M25/M40 family metallo-hydrolase [Thermoanaerobaculia bacterium]